MEYVQLEILLCLGDLILTVCGASETGALHCKLANLSSNFSNDVLFVEQTNQGNGNVERVTKFPSHHRQLLSIFLKLW